MDVALDLDEESDPQGPCDPRPAADLKSQLQLVHQNLIGHGLEQVIVEPNRGVGSHDSCGLRGHRHGLAAGITDVLAPEEHLDVSRIRL
eukprot:CAMPEP_0181423690 /NCGR_PEP_ID=MMETSP1110-20121109/14257_1 /TAXON_ID=174948 /ORGANISM="Symbiodinium sp., Strain CCMP421" /LENGTH=88 /DNA_ID=CAMNT_0023546821 /DNA_START=701 /DNA_END=964 /DNA_ORIENTATION=+